MNWFRPHIQNLVAYSSARAEFSGSSRVFLDANESPFDNGFNRYPDPQQKALKKALARRTGLKTNQIFIGNGSDEAIDLLIRACCEPGKNHVGICSPTYGMYAVAALIQNVRLVDVPLNKTFQLNTDMLIQKGKSCSLLFLCSPNNPSGNLLNREDIVQVLQNFEGLVVIDEAYIDFADAPSWIQSLSSYPNLVVLQTFSKAQGLASLRLGMAFAHPTIIKTLNTIKPPYNVSSYGQKKALECLESESRLRGEVNLIVQERRRVAKALTGFSCVTQVFLSDANFLLFQVKKAEELFEYLISKGIVLRNRNKEVANSLRLSIGTNTENNFFLNQMEQYEKGTFY